MFRVILLLFFSLLINQTFAEEIKNFGFIQGLWYMHEPVFAEQNNRIYVAFRNSSPHDATGVVRFFDNGKRMGSSEIHVLSGRLIEAWVDWKPTYGSHSIHAEIHEMQFHKTDGTIESVSVSDIIAEQVIFIDTDSDHDNIGDTSDIDDDNDGITDSDEATQGTDPKTPNTSLATSTAPHSGIRDDPDNETRFPASEKKPQGLETYVKKTGLHTVLERSTTNIQNARNDLDAYRAKRNEALTHTKESSTSDILDGITRTKIEHTTWTQKIIDGFRGLFSSIYTLILWLTSQMLHHPALIQCTGLIIMLYILYRIARRFGGRRYS